LTLLWIVLGSIGGLGLLLGGAFGLFYWYLIHNYLDHVVRIVQEKPLFIIPRGQPVENAEEVHFPSENGLMLHGCYLTSPAPVRRGVVLFGLEYGSNCWACVPYCENLLANGFDVFTFEPRNCGESAHQDGYDPLQWVTDFEVKDTQAALAYLKGRPGADPRGVGFFGISKGGSAGVLVGARDPYVRCFVTDGIFATYTTMVPYMKKWIAIYSDKFILQKCLPMWVYGLVGRAALRKIGKERGCRFSHLEWAIAKLAPRPWLMIHGEGDTYIKPKMAQALFARAREPKEFWLVPGAKHNQAIQTAGDEYKRRVLEFFSHHLGLPEARTAEPALITAGPTS
jgi:pimeloyl-ACP methyl ester carboxylesterase